LWFFFFFFLLNLLSLISQPLLLSFPFQLPPPPPPQIHCHDWSTAPVAGLLWQNYHNAGLGTPRAVFTIHNADFGLAAIGDAAHHSQAFTTVSPSYANEISGLPAIAPNAFKFSGVRNGIDPDIWDPSNDPFLPVPYDSKTSEPGKKAARDALRQRLGLTGWEDRPVVAVVSRLTEQKGVHLIEHAAWRALDRGAQFVLLGSAPDPKVQARFDALASRLTSENASFVFSFDEPLSHLIYAGADMIVMPSMFEPCGLAQLISVRSCFFHFFSKEEKVETKKKQKSKNLNIFPKKSKTNQSSVLTEQSPSSAPRGDSTTPSSTSTTTRRGQPGRSRAPATGKETASTSPTVFRSTAPTRELSIPH